MTVNLNCPQCRNIFSVAEELKGTQVNCSCGYVLAVPGGIEPAGSPDNFRAQVRQIFTDKRFHLVGDNIYLAPEIPGKKFANALNTFAMGVNGNDALLLIDNTIFGSAKDGCLMTDEALYWHNMNGPFRKLELSALSHVRFDAGVVVKELYFNHT